MNFLQQIPGITEMLFLLAAGSIGVVVYLIVMFRRNEHKTEERLRQARADITDMTILFQTMRDIIGQQKALAKDFNEELEHKMGQVKHILNLGMEKNKQLYDKQQRIAAELEEAQARMEGLFRQLSHADKAMTAVAPSAIPRPVAPAPTPSTPRPADPPPAIATPEPAPAPTPTPRPSSSVLVRRPIADARELPAAPQPARVERPMPPRATPVEPPLSDADRARLAATGVTRAPFSPWIAEDLPEDNGKTATPPPGSPTPAMEPAPVAPKISPRPAPILPGEEEEPESFAPSNGDAAREAFRALLNMPMTAGVAPAPPEMPGQVAGMVSRTDGYGPAPDEGTISAPLQQRVLEYSEAGMTVAEVSRELGIGKGEVRLMLSLARQTPPGQS